jgi:rhodanese-related sulfurtransferase
VAEILDVREADAFNGSLGRIVGTRQIALGYLEKRVNEVANLAGGMLRWQAQQYPIDGGDN